MNHDEKWQQENLPKYIDHNAHMQVAASDFAEAYHEHMSKQSGLNYVCVVSPGMTHCINLFMGDHCIALVDNPETVEKLKAILPDRLTEKEQ